MKTDRQLLEGFKSQFNTGRLFNESQVLVLMGYARGEERRKEGGETPRKKADFECPYTHISCVNLDTTGPTKIPDCSECPNNEMNAVDSGFSPFQD